MIGRGSVTIVDGTSVKVASSNTGSVASNAYAISLFAAGDVRIGNVGFNFSAQDRVPARGQVQGLLAPVLLLRPAFHEPPRRTRSAHATS